MINFGNLAINFGNFGNQFWQFRQLAKKNGKWQLPYCQNLLPVNLPLFTGLAQSYVQTQPTTALGLAHYYSFMNE